ncbi:MAG: hypothetical protein FD167_306 [bacterium]|nr:MAG: hypothetical protein FD167_306 [bacterium]
MATVIEVTKFLREFKQTIDNSGLYFIPRKVNRDGIAKLGLMVGDVKDVIGSLTYQNYSSGPESDQDGSAGEIWIFGTIINSQNVYIKIKLDKGAAKCLSLHPADFRVKQPYNFGGTSCP